MRSTLAAALILACVAAAGAEEIRWMASYEEGVKAAEESGKLLLVAFFAEG